MFKTSIGTLDSMLVCGVMICSKISKKLISSFLKFSQNFYCKDNSKETLLHRPEKTVGTIRILLDVSSLVIICNQNNE